MDIAVLRSRMCALRWRSLAEGARSLGHGDSNVDIAEEEMQSSVGKTRCWGVRMLEYSGLAKAKDAPGCWNGAGREEGLANR